MWCGWFGQVWCCNGQLENCFQLESAIRLLFGWSACAGQRGECLGHCERICKFLCWTTSCHQYLRASWWTLAPGSPPQLTSNGSWDWFWSSWMNQCSFSLYTASLCPESSRLLKWHTRWDMLQGEFCKFSIAVIFLLNSSDACITMLQTLFLEVLK